MSKQAKKSKDDGLAITVRLPSQLVNIVDKWLESMRAEHPGMTLTRSDVVREKLFEMSKTAGG